MSTIRVEDVPMDLQRNGPENVDSEVARLLQLVSHDVLALGHGLDVRLVEAGKSGEAREIDVVAEGVVVATIRVPVDWVNLGDIGYVVAHQVLDVIATYYGPKKLSCQKCDGDIYVDIHEEKGLAWRCSVCELITSLGAVKEAK